jgi:hypothetical protein
MIFTRHRPPCSGNKSVDRQEGQHLSCKYVVRSEVIVVHSTHETRIPVVQMDESKRLEIVSRCLDEPFASMKLIAARTGR